MTYLHPPPGDAPVIVTKDVGGYVNEYGAQTKLYFDTGREVRLHECRSACTLALSLPNVCVYPDSLLKFHKAYNPITKQANDEVSDQMMASYPEAIRRRLGELTRSYKVLTGSELIRLGLRDCNRPLGPNYAVARAKPTPSSSSRILGEVAEVFSGAGAQQGAVQVKPVRIAAAQARPDTPQPETTSARTSAEATPQPPARPADLSSTAPIVTPAPAPPQPEVDIISHWGRPIVGSVPILVATRFTPFRYRSARKS